MAVYMKCEAGMSASPMPIKSEFAGAASQAKHVGWIPLVSVKLPTVRPDVNTAPGNVTDRTTSQVDFQDVEIEKPMDIASANLMKWNISGATYKATIDICKEDGLVVLQIILFDTLLTLYETNCDEDGQVVESISLDYTKISLEFKSYTKANKFDKSDTVIYNLETAAGE